MKKLRLNDISIHTIVINVLYHDFGIKVVLYDLG